MSILMLIVFALLVFEMTLMIIILLPLPQKVQSSIVSSIYTSLQNPQIRIGLYFVAIVVSLMFADSFKTSFPARGTEGSLVTESVPSAGVPISKTIGQSIWDVRSKKFYAQRNLYISGAVLFLLVAIYFDVLLLETLVRNKNHLVEAAGLNKQKGKKDSTTTIEFEKLKEELKQREVDLSTLKKQVEGIHAEYQKKADAEKVETAKDTSDSKKVVETKKDA
ncbi:DEKNAAC104342 [Brettanomyces naardenensis]|uniref:Endoplasmic reticulum transmembrane protein n=1 Tax=Brettanomyces naardenensis TaxID=13370 RepID=A0A448YQT0_BRENA|nr:DEKNAAC104342 [Brettanomyces naardenensis]